VLQVGALVLVLLLLLPTGTSISTRKSFRRYANGTHSTNATVVTIHFLILLLFGTWSTRYIVRKVFTKFSTNIYVYLRIHIYFYLHNYIKQVRSTVCFSDPKLYALIVPISANTSTLTGVLRTSLSGFCHSTSTLFSLLGLGVLVLEPKN
jgi:hypothetical protein